MMAKVVFYEKPGCAGNARQRALLAKSGHDVEVRDLLKERWTAELLRSFFGSRPVSEWFNASSPRVKNGTVDPQALPEETALAMMLEDPLLIRRPLMESGGRRVAGFEAELVDQWIGLMASPAPVTDTCVNTQPCAPVRDAVNGKAT